MNVLIHIIALAASLWCAWLLLDKGQTVPAIVMLGLALMLVEWLVYAVIEDTGDARGGSNKRRGRR